MAERTMRGEARPTVPSTAWLEHDDGSRRLVLASLLAEVSSQALQGDSLGDTLQRITDCLARELPVAIASIILLDEAGTHFSKEVWSGELTLELPSGLPWPIEIGAAGRAVRSGQPQLISDVTADPDYVAGNEAVRSEYLVPIRHRERLHGVLNLESTQADFFSAEVRAVFDAIAAQIAGAIHLARIVHELEQANRRLRQLSLSDGLTGVANRRCFDAQLAEEWQRHLARAQPLALLLVDVDGFKPLNDAAGHLRGDECLREVARQCVAAAPQPEATVARIGGDEFALLLPACDLDAALACAERLRVAVAANVFPQPPLPQLTRLSVSIGVAANPTTRAASAQALVEAADRALYMAKAAGRNCVRGCDGSGRDAAGSKSPTACCNASSLLG
ncbi:MAG: GGDEF domain-containing protein [Xanthomonadales bacterium]|nr:GGDEF domain-containing protein [Xanthomonadales bacterium]MDL1869202.1 sensor domain-containing diguanylate cyclase [Gammaproteobacteria bacterium PRO6]